MAEYAVALAEYPRLYVRYYREKQTQIERLRYRLNISYTLQHYGDLPNKTESVIYSNKLESYHYTKKVSPTHAGITDR